MQWIGLGLIATAIIWGYRMVTRKYPELQEDGKRKEEDNIG